MVFDKDFFLRHQRILLFFLNAPILKWATRRLFYIHGDRSDVGTKKITRMFPDAIEWSNRDGTHSMEFRTHDKFAKRLYYGLYWFWHCLHLWDFFVNSLRIPQYNLGFDSLTMYPQAGEGGSNVTCDSLIERNHASSESFSDLRNGAGIYAYDTASTGYVLLRSSTTSNQFNRLSRIGMTFNTPLLPDTLSVISATLYLYGDLTQQLNSLGNIDINITAFTPAANNDFVASDYSNFSDVSFANIAYGAWANGYNPFSLNGNGLNHISPTQITGFGARSTWDIENSFGGSWASGVTSYLTAYLSDRSGTANDPKLIVTYSTIPTVTTALASNITATSATVGGDVTDDGDKTVTERGVVYALTSNPTTANNKVSVGGTIGPFSTTIQNLLGDTTYYVRAYAINAEGTAYGSDINFKTLLPQKVVPRLTTSPVIQNIRRTQATLIGEILSDGDSSITERGFVFGTSRGATITDDKKIEGGTSVAIFTDTIENLSPSTRYYARSYAINSTGVGYGNEITFITATKHVKKHFYYKIYRRGVFVTTWSSEVISEPNFILGINDSPGQMIINLSRKFDEFSEDVDVRLNNKVECWIVDDDSHDSQLLYCGYISGYKPIIDKVNEYIEVTIFSYAALMAKTVLRTSINETTLAYQNLDPSYILRDLLDKYQAIGGKITYTNDSIADTGYFVSYTFNTNTIKECIDKVLELCPEGWYYYIDADNILYLQPKPGSANHLFFLGKHVKVLQKRTSIENIVNRVLFTGNGIYKIYQDQSSINAYGLYEDKIIDRRVTLDATAEIMSNRILLNLKNPETYMQIYVMDNNGPDDTKGYDIETIKPGDCIQIGKTKSSQDVPVILQILSVNYRPDNITLEASSRLPVVAKRIEDIRRNLELNQTADNPSVPTIG